MCPKAPRESRFPRLSGRSGRRRNLRREIRRAFFDTLAELETGKRHHFDRPADLAFGFLQRLRDTLFVVEDEGLLQKALLLVEGLEPRLGNLLDHRLWLALLAEFVGQNVLLALDHRRVDTRGI